MTFSPDDSSCLHPCRFTMLQELQNTITVGIFLAVYAKLASQTVQKMMSTVAWKEPSSAWLMETATWHLWQRLQLRRWSLRGSMDNLQIIVTSAHKMTHVQVHTGHWSVPIFGPQTLKYVLINMVMIVWQLLNGTGDCLADSPPSHAIIYLTAPCPRTTHPLSPSAAPCATPSPSEVGGDLYSIALHNVRDRHATQTRKQ